MTDLEKSAISLLSGCTFLPGSYPKLFVRDLVAIKQNNPEFELSDKQKNYLWKLTYQYRRQHGNKWFTYYAKTKIEQQITVST